jgi:hypothetical protein
VLAVLVGGAHILSYYVLKHRIVSREKWDLNICCGNTDGGGVNADICEHAKLPNFKLIDNVYDLPYGDKKFENVLCSHTLEHVDDPERFFLELTRVGKRVILVVPPLWDLLAVFDFFSHKYVFLTMRKEHTTLPPFVKLPFAFSIQKKLGQRLHA